MPRQRRTQAAAAAGRAVGVDGDAAGAGPARAVAGGGASMRRPALLSHAACFVLGALASLGAQQLGWQPPALSLSAAKQSKQAQRRVYHERDDSMGVALSIVRPRRPPYTCHESNDAVPRKPSRSLLLVQDVEEWVEDVQSEFQHVEVFKCGPARTHTRPPRALRPAPARPARGVVAAPRRLRPPRAHHVPHSAPALA